MTRFPTPNLIPVRHKYLSQRVITHQPPTLFSRASFSFETQDLEHGNNAIAFHILTICQDVVLKHTAKLHLPVYKASIGALLVVGKCTDVCAEKKSTSELETQCHQAGYSEEAFLCTVYCVPLKKMTSVILAVIAFWRSSRRHRPRWRRHRQHNK